MDVMMGDSGDRKVRKVKYYCKRRDWVVLLEIMKDWSDTRQETFFFLLPGNTHTHSHTHNEILLNGTF